jgi:protein-L-isoaspartate(D-aspartate) O-methyltransferase
MAGREGEPSAAHGRTGYRRGLTPALRRLIGDCGALVAQPNSSIGVTLKEATAEESPTAMKPMNESHLAILRRHMVEVVAIHVDLASDEIGKDKLDERVMAAMLRVPRHLFVPVQLAAYAYQDTPLPIGFDKTISQPFIVALMTDLLSPQPNESVLEVGTGLGYQAAILAELAGQVRSIEIVEEFASHAQGLLDQLGYANVEIRVGDGSRGWREHAPFDKIIVTAAADEMPLGLLEQLKPGGRMVMPLGPEDMQVLTVTEKDEAGRPQARDLIPVRFSRLETVT